MVEGKLIRCYYRSIGQQMMVDALHVDFEVDGTVYTHALPNKNWGYMVPTLQFMGYVGIKPSDFDGSMYEFERDIAIPLMKSDREYFISNKALQLGMKQLDSEDWFNPNGNVWNSGTNQASGGMSFDPGTGNRAAVDGEKE